MFFQGEDAVLEITTQYPCAGEVNIIVAKLEHETEAEILLRQPGWTRQMQVCVNGEPVLKSTAPFHAQMHGIRRTWKQGDTIRVMMEMEPRFMQARPDVRSDCGRTALMKGPIVYCLEEADNDSDLQAVSVDTTQGITEHFREDILDGVLTLECKGYRLSRDAWGDALYRPLADEKEPVKITAIPYCFWNNRGVGEMNVWIRY